MYQCKNDCNLRNVQYSDKKKYITVNRTPINVCDRLLHGACRYIVPDKHISAAYFENLTIKHMRKKYVQMF